VFRKVCRELCSRGETLADRSDAKSALAGFMCDSVKEVFELAFGKLLAHYAVPFGK
jgi:hypothetical protein